MKKKINIKNNSFRLSLTLSFKVKRLNNSRVFLKKFLKGAKRAKVECPRERAAFTLARFAWLVK